MTSAQFSEWEAYDRIDPIGSWREDFRMAYLASVITNLALSIHGQKGVKMTTPMDFMPDWSGERKEEPQQQSVDDMKKIFMELAGEPTTVKKELAIKSKKRI